MYVALMSEGKRPNAEEYRLLQFLWEKACLFICGVSLEGQPPPLGEDSGLPKCWRQWPLGGTQGQSWRETHLSC